MNVGPIVNGYGSSTSASRLCSQTRRYIIKRDIYVGFLQNALPDLLENVPLRSRLQTGQRYISLGTSRSI